ncbi:hypothetical protein BDZ94DRAFT_1258957 [Collybia nuda]|uniref:Uncharacterized protein n=1 Tax=Collybia nuda TaxID=64659 RepID=A0A9P5Y756_9AGAR|nr:hypothetical protein BDZ94DRAFT_1258957 [Collybia nuda]
MAALYIHNAVHSAEPSTSSRNLTSPHNRNISTVSSTTLWASTSEHSHPTEPLLHSETSESVAYLDLLSRQPVYPHGPQPPHSRSISFDGDPLTMRERKGYGVCTWCVLDLIYCGTLTKYISAAFAVYNTVRYFLAYTIYDSNEGQSVSLSMGISTGFAFTLLVCAVILATFQPYLLAHQISLRPLLLCRTVMHALASLLIFGPAVVNTTLLFIWKNSTDTELNILRRCHVDIDVVWSVSNAQCKPAAWGVWLALSLVRLMLTLFIIIAYHMIATAYHRIRRPSHSRSRRSRYGNGMGFSQSSSSPSMAGLPIIPSHHRPTAQHQSSDSTLLSNANSKFSSTTNHLARTSGNFTASSLYSDEDISDEPHNDPPNTISPGQDHEFTSFADRFRSLVSQITRETEEALEFARPNHPTPPPETDLEDDFYPPRLPPTVGYDEFGQPYPPEEHILILNGYIRRMPTIESMGSREMGSVTPSSMYNDRDTRTLSLQSSPPASRPPTRTNTASRSEYAVGSRSSSRSNSLAAGAEILAAPGRTSTSEIGELAERGLGGRTNSTAGTESSYPSTMSYYTATSYGSVPDRENSPSPGGDLQTPSVLRTP